mgnify:CR=1 FL=1
MGKMSHLRKELEKEKMKPASAKAKGKALEDFIAERLVKTGIDPTARRSYSSGSGLNKTDVENQIGLAIEAKNQRQAALWKWWKQAERQSEMTHTIPVLVAKPPQMPLEASLAVVPWYFMEKLLTAFLRHSGALEEVAERPNIKWKLLKIKQLCQEITKNIE